jgi:hypothetical protein
MIVGKYGKRRSRDPKAETRTEARQSVFRISGFGLLSDFGDSAFGLWPRVGEAGPPHRSLSQILLQNEDVQENALDGPPDLLTQGGPSGTAKESFAKNHEILLQPPAGEFAIGFDFSATAAMAIESDVAERGIKCRLIKQVQLIRIEAVAKPKPSRDLRKPALERRGRRVCQSFQKIVAVRFYSTTILFEPLTMR